MTAVSTRIAEKTADLEDWVRPKRTDPTRRDPAAGKKMARAEVAKELARGSRSAVAPFDVKAFSIRELMNETFAPMRWVVEDYVPEGTILVAGKPKSGKSWFAMNVLLSAKLGERYLNKSVKQSGGLYLALEDNPRRMQSRMRILMKPHFGRLDDLDGFEYRCEWPAGQEGAAALDEYLTAHPDVKIVVVDVLKNIRPRSTDRSKTGYDLDYEAIEPWKQVAQRHRVTLMIVHHTRKAEAEDAFDEISGTLGLNGVVDGMIVIRSVPGNHKQATAHFRGRDLEEDHEIGIELRDGWWEAVGSAKAIAANDSRKLVLDVLRDQESAMTCAEILGATGKKSRGSMDKLLNKMVDDGLLERSGHRYAPPLS